MVYPPAAADINGEYYQLNAFDIYTDEYFTIEMNSLAEAVNASVSIYGAGTLNTVELANITAMCDRLGVARSEIEVFEHYGIKGDKNFHTLGRITVFCPVLKKYLSIKSIPLKTIAVFDKLEVDFRRFVKNTVAEKEISVQEFRKMVNLLFDMQSDIGEEEIGPDLLKRLAEKKDMTRLSFMKQMQNLSEGIPANVVSESSFETGELTFSFKASGMDEFKEKLTALRESEENIERIFRFLDEQDIC